MSDWQFEGSALQQFERLQERRRLRPGYRRAAEMDMDVRVWRDVAKLVLSTERPSEDTLRYALLSYSSGKISPSHPAIRLLEQYRLFLRGERSPLTEDELAPLRDLPEAV